MESQVTVRIPEDLKRALDEASRKMQRKGSEIVRMALRAFLEEAPGPGAPPVDRAGGGPVGPPESGDPALVEKVLEVSGEKTERAAVDRALTEFIARREQKRILRLFEKLEWNPDFDPKAERSRR